jgi:hypothetical protein
MANSAVDQIKVHLEFLGYKITERDVSEDKNPFFFFKHAAKPNLSIRSYRGGVLLTTLYKGNETAQKERQGYLTFINSANAGASVTRCYTDEEANFIIESWYPENYERASFGVFLELWDSDTEKSLNLEDARKFLR